MAGCECDEFWFDKDAELNRLRAKVRRLKMERDEMYERGETYLRNIRMALKIEMSDIEVMVHDWKEEGGQE